MSEPSIKIIETDETPASVKASAGAGYGFQGTRREFKGNGANDIRTPYLREIYGIIVGGHVMTLHENRTVPVDATQENFQTMPCPMVTLTGKGENTILRRSAFSNDGIWQSGMPIEIWGRWAEPPKAAAAPKPAEPAKEEPKKEEPKKEEGK